MSIDDLELKGYIKKLPVDKRRIQNALDLAKRDIKTAKSMLQQDMDWAFSIGLQCNASNTKSVYVFKRIQTIW